MILSPVVALVEHTRRQFAAAALPTPSTMALEAAAGVVIRELRPHLRGALYSDIEPVGKFQVGGGGLYLSAFERSSEDGEAHYAQAVNAARAAWEVEAGLVEDGERPVSVAAVLHNPPGAVGLVGYPHDAALAVYGRHATLIPRRRRIRWYPGDTHNLRVFGRLESMSRDHAVVMAATEGHDDDPLLTGIPGGVEYPEGLVMGGLTLRRGGPRFHAEDLRPQLWHPSGISYGAWRVLCCLDGTKMVR